MALPPVEVVFAIGGLKELQAAFRDVAKSIDMIQRKARAGINFGGGSGGGFGGGMGGGDPSKWAADLQKYSESRMRAMEKEFYARSRFQEKQWRDGAKQESAARVKIVESERKFNSNTAKEAAQQRLAGLRMVNVAEEKSERDKAVRERAAARRKESLDKETRRAASAEAKEHYGLLDDKQRHGALSARRFDKAMVAKERARANAYGSSRASTEIAGMEAGGGLASGLLESGAGLAVQGAMSLFSGAVSIVSSALSSLGSFIVGDVIAPQLKLGMQMTQLSNRMGGGVAGGARMTGEVNAWALMYAGSLTREQITGTYGQAIDLTHDPKAASATTGAALKIASALGEDPEQIAKMLGYAQSDMRKLSPAMLEAFATEATRKTMAVGSGMHISEFGSIRDRLGTWTSLSRPQSDEEEAALRIGYTALVAQGSKGAHRLQGGVAGIDRFINDAMKNDLDHPGARLATDASGAMLPIAGIIARYVTQAKGDMTMLGPLGKGGKQLAGYGFGGGFTQTSLDVLRQLGVDSIWRDAEAQKKGSGSAAVETHLTDMMKISGKSATLDEEAANVAGTPAAVLARAIESLTQSFYGLVPVVTGSLIPALQRAIPDIEKMIKEFSKGLEGIKFDGAMEAVKSFAQVIGIVAYGMLQAMKTLHIVDLSDEAIEDVGASVGVPSAKSAVAKRAAKAALDTKALREGGVDPADYPGSEMVVGTWTGKDYNDALTRYKTNLAKPLDESGPDIDRSSGAEEKTYFNAVTGKNEAADQPQSLGAQMAAAFIAKVKSEFNIFPPAFPYSQRQ